MLGVSKISGSGEGYYIDAVAKGADEYYRGVGEAPGWWAGTVTDYDFDLDGEVDSEDLQALWSGLDPDTGVKLGAFPNRKVRGFDLCWKAPKAVSLLFAFGSPDVSRVVRCAHDNAVAESLRYLETEAARTRTGHGGATGASVGGLAAAMLALRRSDVDDLNGRARRHMVTTGQLSGPALDLHERPYQAGDEIVCLRNDYRLGVRNGDRATVERVDPDHRTMRVRLAAAVRTLPTEYLDDGHVAHGYATTIHKAQGMTVDRSFVLGTDDLYRQAGYVTLSRGREANTLYTVGGRGLEGDFTHAPAQGRGDDADLVREGLSRENAKRLAIETPDLDHEHHDQDERVQRIGERLDALGQRSCDTPERGLGLGW